MIEPAVAALPDPPEPEALFSRIAHLPYAAWLDSATGETGRRGHSFVACDPFAVLESRNGAASWTTSSGRAVVHGSPLDALAAALQAMRLPPTSPLPFAGGAVGYLGYELGGETEGIPVPAPDDHGLPDLHLAFYDVVVGWGHETGECHVISTGRPASGEAGRRRARRRLEAALAWIGGGAVPPPAIEDPGSGREEAFRGGPARAVAGRPGLVSTASPSEYRDAVAAIIDAIRDGDVYQVNLSQRFARDVRASPADIYSILRRCSPAPYGALLRAGDAWVLSSSPERFLRVGAGGTVETRPIKGTRPRGDGPEEDARLAAELRASEKDRAENLMIVDLLRNDLGRVCRPGSVEVPELFRLESWATVHHLVSCVRGRLREGVSVADLLRATFPCGSVTGAPKIAAMEKIAAIETVRRGPYCGAIGYFGFDGRIDLSVAIRIVCERRGRVAFHAGGGVVADSDPDDEYRETLAKARGIIEAIATAEASA